MAYAKHCLLQATVYQSKIRDLLNLNMFLIEYNFTWVKRVTCVLI
jgi:hypothetical protein